MNINEMWKRNTPIFIHSLYRSGSTHLFHVFRRSPKGYWCYQESIHENVWLARERRDEILSLTDNQQYLGLRHPTLDKPYFYEMWETHDAWRDLIRKEIIYDAYFGGTSENENAVVRYFDGLICAAKGRPVFQKCRTTSRIAQIKGRLGGIHIYLWRNPWDQWWSYQLNDYLSRINLLILNARPIPAVVERLRDEIGFQAFHSDNLGEEIPFFQRQELSLPQGYLVFYALWLLGLQEGTEHADLLLNIDALSDHPAYREFVVEQLQNLGGIEGLDFHDCRVAQNYYAESERKSFEAIEARVHDLFRESACVVDVDEIARLRQAYQPTLWKIPLDGDGLSQCLLESARRAREVVERLEFRAVTRERREREEEAKLLRRLYDAEVQVKALGSELVSLREELSVVSSERDWYERLWRESEERGALLSTHLAAARAEGERIRKEVERLLHDRASLEREFQSVREQVGFLEARIYSLLRSYSWRVTAPLR